MGQAGKYQFLKGNLMGVATMGVFSSSSIADGVVTNAKLAAEACSASKMKKEGTASWVLTSNGGGSVPSYQVVGGITSPMSLISTANFSSDKADFTGLSGDNIYFFTIDVSKTDATSTYLEIFANADETAAHYVTQHILFTDSTSGSNRSADAVICNLAASGKKNTILGYCWKDTNGYFVWNSTCYQNIINTSNDNSTHITTGCQNNSTIAEITEINFKSRLSTTTGHVSLYKIAR